nr:MAG TPA: hypothetical protein [Caudoviricetes sp.]
MLPFRPFSPLSHLTRGARQVLIYFSKSSY